MDTTTTQSSSVPLQPSLVVAYNLIGRAYHAAVKAKDHGKQFFHGATFMCLGVEISFRQKKANELRAVSLGIAGVQAEIKQALANDGVIDKREALRIRLQLVAPQERVAAVAEELDIK